MRNLISKVWNTSPKNWFQYLGFIRKDAKPATEQYNHAPKWHKILNGPAVGYEIYIDPKAFEGWQEMIDGSYDSFMFDEIKEYKDEIIWDIGAHFGYSSLVFSSLVGSKGKIVSFEPNRVNFERLQLHIKHNNIKNIEIASLALSDSIGRVQFIGSEDIEGSPSTGSHLSDIMAPRPDSLYDDLGFKKYFVETNTIDNLISIYPKPSILKIDVEGAEYNVLRGAESFLVSNSVKILMEVHNVLAMYDVLKFLTKMDYKTKILDRQNASVSRTFLFCWK